MRIVCDTLFQALHYSYVFSLYSPVSSADFGNNRFGRQSASSKLPSQGPKNTYYLACWRRVLLFAFASTSPSTAPSYTSLRGHIPLPPQRLSDNFDEEVVFFRHDAGCSVYIVFIGFEPASRTKSVETTFLAFAGLRAWIVSLEDFLRARDLAEADSRSTPLKYLGSSFAQPPSARKSRAPGRLVLEPGGF